MFADWNSVGDANPTPGIMASRLITAEIGSVAV